MAFTLKNKAVKDFNASHYIADSTRGQDEANPVFWLATRAGKMGLSCQLGIARFVPAKAKLFGEILWPYNKSFIDQACSVKVQDGWILGSFLFVSVRIKTKKKKKLANIQPPFPHAWSITHIYVAHILVETPKDIIINLRCLEQFSIECGKTKTKVITTANQNKDKYHNEPMRTQSKYT